MRKIGWTPPAIADLRRINVWLRENATAAVALRVTIDIRKRARFLEDFPRGGRPVSATLRLLRVFGTPYLILYRIEDDGVQVIRVHHEREDWQVEI